MRRAGLVAVAVALAGCGGSSHTTVSSAPPPTPLATGFHLVIPAFGPGGGVPRQYTCDGADTPIPLHWSGVPRGAKELALVIRDPDAPGGDFVHWAVAGISPTSTSVPAGAVQGRNSFGSIGYRGPCPPHGQSHHYVISLSALSGPSGLKPGFRADQLHTAAVAITTVIRTYSRR